MPDSPTSFDAVFVSYAREDAAAAQRIAEALRSFSVEAWFDRSELRGGEAWDGKIYGQIRACVLFLAIISAQTQARREGYFRREWKLAVERTHDMAEGIPFIVPVVIDDTAESRALVPAEFLRVQWTRLPGGLPSPQFVEQIKRLLAQTSASGMETGSPAQAGKPRPVERSEGAASPAKRRVPSWMWAAVGVAAVGLMAFFGTRKSETPAPRPKPVAETSATPATPKINEKSLAVLPFENLSPDKENEFFTSGIHEEILAALQTVRELRVIQYRGAKKSIRQVGEELSVAYALECSVRRAGTKVRVTGKLTNTRTEEQTWVDNFEVTSPMSSPFSPASRKRSRRS